MIPCCHFTGTGTERTALKFPAQKSHSLTSTTFFCWPLLLSTSDPTTPCVADPLLADPAHFQLPSNTQFHSFLYLCHINLSIKDLTFCPQGTSMGLFYCSENANNREKNLVHTWLNYAPSEKALWTAVSLLSSPALVTMGYFSNVLSQQLFIEVNGTTFGPWYLCSNYYCSALCLIGKWEDF